MTTLNENLFHLAASSLTVSKNEYIGLVAEIMPLTRPYTQKNAQFWALPLQI
jgi:hypothetical protein